MRIWVAAGMILCSSLASAASFDPELDWRTITTDHFRIHFHQGEEQLAKEFSHTVESVYPIMVEEIRWKPKRRTEVVLVDRTDIANGYATTLPRNTIVIYVTAPQEDSALSLYEDWNEAIFTHEFTHILHMDTHHGIVTAARAVIGRIASTNSVSPAWIVEGFATFQETRHSAGGRGRAPMADMIKRTAVLEDEFPPLGNLDGFQPDPPSGNLRYLFGQDFIQFVADTHGEDVWTRWVHRYGSGIPYLIPSKRVFGETFPKMYWEWRGALRARYHQQQSAVEADGMREGRSIQTNDASCSSPRFSPDGAMLLWSCSDLRRGPALWQANSDGSNPRILKKNIGGRNFTWRNDSQAFAFASTHIVNRFNSWSDVYLFSMPTRQISALTNGKRARDPEFSPDGSRLWVVTNRSQNNQLEVMTIDRRTQRLTENTSHIQYSQPRFSPNGLVVAISVWEEGRRDLWLYSPEGKPLRRLTFDQASDRDPEWSADGKTLYFTSERSGIPNIYALDLDTEQLWQVTNVLTGASSPSVHPHGLRIAYQQYTSHGWEIRLIPLDRSHWIDRGKLPRPIDQNTPLAQWAELHSPLASTDQSWVGSPVQLRKFHAVDEKLQIPFLPGPMTLSRQLLASPAIDSNGPIHQDTGESLDQYEQSKVTDAFGESKDYPFTLRPRKYNPLKTLLPTYWLPALGITPYEARVLKGITKGEAKYFAFSAKAVTGGRDVLGFLSWDALLYYRTDANTLGYGGNLIINRWLPVFAIGGLHQAVPYDYFQVVDDESSDNNLILAPGARYWERRSMGYLSISYPYTYKTTLFTRYSLTHRASLDPIPKNAYLPSIPARGTIGALSAGWRYAWGKGTPYAISPEDTQVVSIIGSLLAPWLGTFLTDENGEMQGLTQFQLTADFRNYLVIPKLPNHVLAMRFAAGVTLGPQRFQGNYALGGAYGDSAFIATPDEFRMLRGYYSGADIGDMYWLGGLEYRMPIWRMEHGLSTLPFYFRHLTGAVFVDIGNAFNEVTSWHDPLTRPLVGVGTELRLSMILGWSTPVTLRLGYAVGVTPPDNPLNQRNWGDLGAFYIRSGSSF